MARSHAAIIVLMLLLPAMALLVGPVAGQLPPELRWNSIRDYAVDTDRTGLYNELLIPVDLNVTQEGSYTIACVLTVDASGNTYVIDTVQVNPWFDKGDNTVVLTFPSEEIFRTGRSGVFQAAIEVQKFDYANPWKFTYMTRSFYNYSDFQAPENPPPVPPDAPVVEAGPNSINISTEVFQVFVNRTSPTIVFRYRNADASMPDFVITYYQLILFDDDGDRLYNGEDPMATVLLSNYPWTAGNIEVSGAAVSYDFTARVPVPVGPDFVSADITLTFTLTNGTLPEPEASGFIRGDASELKVDILFEPEEPMPGADSVAFEYRVKDTMGSHSFLVEELAGAVLYPRTQETTFLPVPQLPLSTYSTIGLVNDNMVMHAFVGWQNQARESWSEGDPLMVDVGGSFRVRGGQIEVYNTYPFSEDLVSLDHDPSVGTVAENRPLGPGPAPLPEEATPNPYVFWFAVIAGAVIILLTLYARAQGY